MTWEQRYRLRLGARTSLVLWAVVSLIAALLVAPAVRWLDQETGWVVFGFSPDGARAVLGALVASMLTFIVFVLSASLIVVQLASVQLTPRVIGLVFTLPAMKSSLGLFTFTFTYTLSALGRVEDRVPDLHVGVAVLLNLVCILGFFWFAQRLSTGLRPTSMMKEVADRGRMVIEQVYPQGYDPGQAEQHRSGGFSTSPAVVVEYVGWSGVVMAFSVADLVRLARDAGAIVELVPQVGDFVAAGDPLFRVHDGTRPLSPQALRGCVAVGAERTLDQDPRFAFRILVDIASKALSPAVNDPTTAVQCLDHLHDLLRYLAARPFRSGRLGDQDGALRLVVPPPSWEDYLDLALDEIRHYGATSIQVARRIRAIVDDLATVVSGTDAAAVKRQRAMLDRAVDENFTDPEERALAGRPDAQGLGSTVTG
jgi:uncharacterized membrane protein